MYDAAVHIVTDSRLRRWWCPMTEGHSGPCPLRPLGRIPWWLRRCVCGRVHDLDCPRHGYRLAARRLGIR